MQGTPDLELRFCNRTPEGVGRGTPVSARIFSKLRTTMGAYG
jgi:hypothetical protein